MRTKVVKVPAFSCLPPPPAWEMDVRLKEEIQSDLQRLSWEINVPCKEMPSETRVSRNEF